MRAAIYLRVSTDEQAGPTHASLEVQELRCRGYVDDRHGTIVAIEQDTESGLKATRVGYQRVLELARNGAIDGVVVFAASRFGRRASEVLSRVEELRGLGVELYSTAEDLSSFLMLGIQAILNEHETRVILERTMPAKRRKTEQGYWMAHAPLGTVNDAGVLRPGPRFDLVRLAFQLAAEGENVAAIARRLSDAISPEYFTYARIIKVLRNRLYIGEVSWGGVTAKAAWEPMIDLDVFERANAHIARRYVERRQLTRAYPYWVLGLAFCGRCGSRMHPKVGVSRWSGASYPYLVCGGMDKRRLARTCMGTEYSRMDHLQDWIVEQLQEIRINAASVEDCLARLSSVADQHQAQQAQRRSAIENERRRLEARLHAAKAAHLDAPDTFSIADVRRIQAGVNDSLAAIDRELAEPISAPGVDIDELRTFLLQSAWMDRRHDTPAAFRAFLQTFIERVDVAGPGEYSIAWRPAMAGVFQTVT